MTSPATTAASSADQRPLNIELASPPLPSTTAELEHIPGASGKPFIGHTLQFVRDTEGLVARMRRQHGRDFRINLFGYPVVMIGDPESVKHVLLDREQNFSSRLGWHHAIGELFARGLMLRDFDEHRMHRRIMQTAFKADAMRTYTEMMNPLITRSLDAWPTQERMLFYPAIKRLTLDLAAEVFLGVPLGNEADRLNRAFVDSVQASIALVKAPVPGLSYWRGMRGRRLLEQFFSERIPERRSQPGSDMFTQFCQATSDEGESFSDRDIVDHMIFLLMAAHDTTTSSLSSLVYRLAMHPEWQEQLREEAHALGKPQVEWQDKDHFRLLDQAFKETLRLHPPVPSIGRRSVRACQIGGVEIPANSALSVCSLITHFLEDLWPSPETFDPGRFSPERAEDRVHSHAWYPFGGGAHTCLGMHFAYIQVKAVMHQLLLRYRITLSPGEPVEMIPIPIPRPRNGLPVSLERL